MGLLNVFIDGSWLFRQCIADGSLANATDRPGDRFPLDFERLNEELLRHVSAHGGKCSGFGERVMSMSIFALPDDFDQWPLRFSSVRPENVVKTRNAVWARQRFVEEASQGGYGQEAVFRPALKEWMIRRLNEGSYQEKQVDTAVVALLVRSAITRPDDFHVVITGDADVLPAIQVACPKFTKNVFVATTHPDELDSRLRQTAYSLVEIGFVIPPYFMQNKGSAEKIIAGPFPYRCEECGRVFVLEHAITRAQRPRCGWCRPTAGGGARRGRST